MNWDLRREPFKTLKDPYEGFFPQSGPFVLPGTYKVKIEWDDVQQTIIEDKGGDALDSVIAAMATFTAIRNEDVLIPDDNGLWMIEGYVSA